MSLIVAIYVPTGIVVSGDSRSTATRAETLQDANDPNRQLQVQTNFVFSDAARKIFLLHDKFGVGTFGAALINNLPIAHYVEQFEAESRGEEPDDTQDLANKLMQFFRSLQPIPQMGLLVVGYDEEEPWVISVDGANEALQRTNYNEEQQRVGYGIVRGGAADVVNRLLADARIRPRFEMMNMQDAVDYSRHLIRATIDQMRFEPRFSTVGGPIDTLVVKSTGAELLRHKALKAS